MTKLKIKTCLLEAYNCHEEGNLKNMKIMSTFEKYFLEKLIYVSMFLGFLLSFRVLGFLKLVYLYIEVPKNNVDTFSHILNFISLKRWFSLFLA